MADGLGSATVPVYQLLAEQIRREGIDVVFGLMSDDTAALVATLDAIGVRFCAARHESTAIAMAEGYASASGKVAIAIVGRGPAAANALHGAAYASRTGSKVLVIYGEAPPAGILNRGLGPDNKAFDATAVLAGAGLRPFTAASAETAVGTLLDALAHAERGHAAALLLPVDVQQQGALPIEQRPRAQAQPPRAQPRPAALETAASLLARSRRPLILAGLGAHRAGARASLDRLAEHVGAVVATTLRARGFFRGNPFDAGIVGSFSHAAGRRLIDQADCVVIFGASMNRFTMSFGAALPAGAPIIHVDIDRTHVNRWSSADVAIAGDAVTVSDRLVELLPARGDDEKPFRSDGNRQLLATFDRSTEFVPANTERTLDPRSLAVEFDRIFPQDRNVVTDTGNFFAALAYVDVPGPDAFKITSDFASIGMGFGVALGHALARPQRPTALFLGDGSFLMTLGELETAARENIPLTIVVMNDCAYGAELHLLKARNLPVAKALFPDVDFASVAEAFGFHVATVRTIADLHALAPVLGNPAGAQILIDCKINASVMASFLSEYL